VLSLVRDLRDTVEDMNTALIVILTPNTLQTAVFVDCFRVDAWVARVLESISSPALSGEYRGHTYFLLAWVLVVRGY
jgi:hypothetical protein